MRSFLYRIRIKKRNLLFRIKEKWRNRESNSRRLTKQDWMDVFCHLESLFRSNGVINDRVIAIEKKLDILINKTEEAKDV